MDTRAYEPGQWAGFQPGSGSRRPLPGSVVDLQWIRFVTGIVPPGSRGCTAWGMAWLDHRGRATVALAIDHAGAVLAAAVLLFLFFGQYTRRATGVEHGHNQYHCTPRRYHHSSPCTRRSAGQGRRCTVQAARHARRFPIMARRASMRSAKIFCKRICPDTGFARHLGGHARPCKSRNLLPDRTIPRPLQSLRDCGKRAVPRLREGRLSPS